MCKIFKAYTHETVLYLTINPRKQKTNQTKTKLSPQGPQWSRHSVARGAASRRKSIEVFFPFS